MAANSKCVTVLLVDDDPSQLKLFSWIMSHAGYRPITALVGGTGVSFPRGIKPDVAVMDYIYRSQLVASDIQRLIKSYYPAIPIVLISEVPVPPDDMRGLVDAFVTKGDQDALASAIEKLCGLPKHKARRGAA